MANKRIVYDIVLNYQQAQNTAAAAGAPSVNPATYVQKIVESQQRMVSAMQQVVQVVNNKAVAGTPKFSNVQDIDTYRRAVGQQQFDQAVPGVGKLVDTIKTYMQHVEASLVNGRVTSTWEGFKQDRNQQPSAFGPTFIDKLQTAITGSRSLTAMGALAYGQPGALTRSIAGTAIQSVLGSKATARSASGGETSALGSIADSLPGPLGKIAGMLMDTPVGMVAGAVAGVGAAAMGVQGMRADARADQASLFAHVGNAFESTQGQLSDLIGAPTPGDILNLARGQGVGSGNWRYGYGVDQMRDVYNQMGDAGVQGSLIKSALTSTLGFSRLSGIDPTSSAEIAGNVMAKMGGSADDLSRVFQALDKQFKLTGVPVARMTDQFKTFEQVTNGIGGLSTVTGLASLSKQLGGGINVGQMFSPAFAQQGGGAIAASGFLGMSVDKFEGLQKSGDVGKMVDAISAAVQHAVGTGASDATLQAVSKMLNEIGLIGTSGVTDEQNMKAMHLFDSNTPNKQKKLEEALGKNLGMTDTKTFQDQLLKNATDQQTLLGQIKTATEASSRSLANLDNTLDRPTGDSATGSTPGGGTGAGSTGGPGGSGGDPSAMVNGMPGNLSQQQVSTALSGALGQQQGGVYRMWDPQKKAWMYGIRNDQYGTSAKVESGQPNFNPYSDPGFASVAGFKKGQAIPDLSSVLSKIKTLNWGDVPGDVQSSLGGGGTGGGSGGLQFDMSGGATGGSVRNFSGGRVPVSQSLLKMYMAAARRYNVPLGDMLAMGAQESGFDPTARNASSGAMGIAQFLPSTVGGFNSGVGTVEGDPTSPFYHKQFNAYDPAQAIQAQGWYVDKQRQWHGGDLFSGIAGYGEGPGYASSVMGNAQTIMLDISGKLVLVDQNGQVVGTAAVPPKKHPIQPKRQPVASRSRKHA